MMAPESLNEVNPVVVSPPGILHAALVDGTFTLSFGTEGGKTYDVEYAECLTKPKWPVLQSASGDGGLAVVCDPARPVGQRYYRIRTR